GARDQSREATLLDHQHDRAALRLQQVGGGFRNLTVERGEIGARKQRRRQFAQPLQFAVATRRALECTRQRRLLPGGGAATLAECYQCERRNQRREGEARVTLTDREERNGDPEAHQRDGDQRTGASPASVPGTRTHPAIEPTAGHRVVGHLLKLATQVASSSSSTTVSNTVVPSISIRRR